jgi:hypothetical protein
MPCNIYLDTSILCALADPPARSAYARTCQSLTRRWFRALPHTRHLCTSEIALNRIQDGPVALVSARLSITEPLSIIPGEKIHRQKAELFLAGGGLRSNTNDLGLEIACAASHGIALFLTWNWQSLEAHKLPELHLMLEFAGLPQLDFITPLQLLEVNYETLQTAGRR